MKATQERLTFKQRQEAIDAAVWIDCSEQEWPTMDQMWLLCNALLDLSNMYDAALKENSQLRLLLATSNAKCAYCGLPAEEMAKCASGFPGCARGDDMLLDGTPTRQELVAELEAAKADAERYAFLKSRFVRRDYSHDLGGYALCTVEVYDETLWAKDRGKSFDYRDSFDTAVDAEMERRYE